jgi:ubiquitin carboxyl-terminal hydrolase 8
LQVLQEKSNEFDGIKQLIKMDNEASGVLSSSDQTARPQTKPENTRGEILNRKKAGGLERPEVRAKPDFLSSKVISPRSSTGSTYDAKSNDIHARFQRLSMGHGYRPSSTVSKAPSSASMPLSPTTRPTSQPYGPREMPTKPPKLDMKNGLPKLPEPTYSPTTSYGSPGGLSPPRSSARILVGTSKQIENTKQTLPHPTETILSVEDLSAHLKAGSTRSVLLLDVRAREDYEQGHIPSRSIACIEPISLRDG